jgi:imidazole glycerol-phosphate synthase subunit HisH
MIVVVDYGMGNLGSVVKALAYLGVKSTVSHDPKTVAGASRLILPGVGAMPYAMKRLKANGLDEAIARYIETERPFLGICLGMQLLFEQSEEGSTQGLSLLPGIVRRFPNQPGLKIPHMGWNRIRQSRLSLVPDGTDYYFVHSYYVQPADPGLTAATSTHGVRFTAAVQTGSMVLTQFHPEKSGDAGLDFLSHWISDPLPGIK